MGERVVELESREKQKLFLTFAGEALRKVFFLQQGIVSLAGVAPAEEAFYRDVAARCKPSFPRRGVEILGKAAALLERNVAQKLILTNVVDRLIVSI